MTTLGKYKTAQNGASITDAADGLTYEIDYYVNGQRRIHEPGCPLEKRMLCKIDLRMLLCVCAMSLLNCRSSLSQLQHVLR